MKRPPILLTIMSGGQTGADRAGLDAAIALNIPYAGWCPHGGSAEDMPSWPGILARYPALRETASDDPAERTRLNVRDSSATLLLTSSTGLDVSKGARLAVEHARELQRPFLVLDIENGAGLDAAYEWIASLNEPQPAINIAGPRESEAPGLYRKAYAFLRALLPRFSRLP